MKDRKEIIERLWDQVERQDRQWGAYESIQLGFACLEDEVQHARNAYDEDPQGVGFSHTQELLWIAAIAVRLLETLP